MNSRLLDSQVLPESSYSQYLALGGTITSEDYNSARQACCYSTFKNRSLSINIQITQVEGIARHSGILLEDSKIVLDKRIALYIHLRSICLSDEKNDRHIHMCDQRLFGEVLRILGDSSSLKKLLLTYPNISI